MLMDRELILQMVKTKTTIKQALTLWEYTRLQRAWFPASTTRSRVQRHMSIIHGQPKRKQISRAPEEPPIAVEVEPEIQMGVEPEEQRNVEVQAQPVPVSLRKGLAANLNPVPDMPTAEKFLVEWVSVATGGTSTLEFITAITSPTVTAVTMQQLVETPRIQIMTIPVTIPLTTAETPMVVDTTPIVHSTTVEVPVEVTTTPALVTSVAQSLTTTAPSAQGAAVESSKVIAAASVTLQGKLWKEEREESERIVELELDQGDESQNESQKGDEVQEKEDQKETTSESSRREGQRKEDMRSTLTSEPESDEEPVPQPPPSAKLKPIPSLFDVPLPTGDATSSADFNLDDPLVMKAMRAGHRTQQAPRAQRGQENARPQCQSSDWLQP